MGKSYYAILPANVRYDKNLTPNAKLLYAEITALTNEKGYCWATNSYFAKLYGVNKGTISSWIKNLKDSGYIKIDLIYGDGGKNIEKRYIYLKDAAEKTNEDEKEKDDPIHDFMYSPPENDVYPIHEIMKENNTFNNTFNNTKNNTFNSFKESPKNKKTELKTFSDNPDLDAAIKEFIKNRKALKKPMTDRAITLFINKLDREFKNDDEKIEAIDIAIMRGWLSTEKSWIDNIKASGKGSQFRSFEDSQKIAKKRWEGFLNADEG